MDIKFRTEYNYDRNEASRETALICKDPSRTKQEFAEDADINHIIERFGIGYEMPTNVTPPQQGDFTNIPDFRGAVEMVREAQQLFGSLPAKIRNRFDNDPQQYIDFFHDPANQDEAIALGLATKRVEGQTAPNQPPAPKAAEEPPKTA